MNLSDLEYLEILDWKHCETLREANQRLSEITIMLNKIIMITKGAEKELIFKMADHGEAIDDKLSMNNKIIKLLALNRGQQTIKDLCDVFIDGKSITSQLKHKKKSIEEDINSIKKIEGWRE